MEGHGDRYLDPPLSTKSEESIVEIGSSFLFAHYPLAIHPAQPPTGQLPGSRGHRVTGIGTFREGHGDRYLDPPLSTKSGESIIEIGSSFLFARYPPAIHPAQPPTGQLLFPVQWSVGTGPLVLSMGDK